MHFVEWMKREMADKTSSLVKRTVSHEQDELRTRLVQTQRALTMAWEQKERSLQKRLSDMVQRIRGWHGSVPEGTRLEAEQRQMGHLLERFEVSDADTVELLHEWRDWMRALRRGLSYDVRRVELVGSELRLRGIIGQDEYPALNASSEGDVQQDSFFEWDSYVGQHLPTTQAFWERRVTEMGEEGVHGAVLHAFVKQAKQVHGQAHAWRRVQDR